MISRLSGEVVEEEVIDLDGMSEDYKEGYGNGWIAGYESGVELIQSRQLAR